MIAKIQYSAWRKLNNFAFYAQPNEAGGKARFYITDNNEVIITDVYMITGDVSPASYEPSAEDMASFMRFVYNDDSMGDLSEWNMLVHSHPIGMSAKMSETDRGQLRDDARANNGHAFSLIIGSSERRDSLELKLHYAYYNAMSDTVDIHENNQVSVIVDPKVLTAREILSDGGFDIPLLDILKGRSFDDDEEATGISVDKYKSILSANRVEDLSYYGRGKSRGLLSSSGLTDSYEKYLEDYSDDDYDNRKAHSIPVDDYFDEEKEDWGWDKW